MEIPEIKIKEYFSPTYETIKRLRTPEKLYISSSVLPDSVINTIMMEIKEELEQEYEEYEKQLVNYKIREMFGMPVIKTDYGLDYSIKFFKNNKTEKETKKMEAKKCDRCGKLYEMPGARESGSGAKVRFKFEQVARAEEKSGTKIAEEQMKDIYIKYGFAGDTFVDFCPDCRASLKKWFENPEKEGK